MKGDPSDDPGDERVRVGGRLGFSLVCDVCDASWFSDVKAEVEVSGVMLVLCLVCQRDLS